MEKAIYFISDAHLSHLETQDTKSRREKLIEFLQSIHGADALYILGDLFDFWFDYKHVIPKYHHQIFCGISSLRGSGTKIYILGGNHDFWLGDFFTNHLDVEIIPPEHEITINGKRFFLAHGDGLLPGDTGYKILKSILRSRVAIFLFKWLHPDIGFKFAEMISQSSRRYNSSEDAIIERLTILGEEFAKTKFKGEIDFVLFGHIHRPHQLNDGKKRFLILGDWMKYFSYGKFENNKLSLHYWS